MARAKSDKSRPSGRPGEQAWLEQYRPELYPRPAVTVDLVVLTIIDADLKVLLVRRKQHPFKDAWALPGGFVRVGPDANDQGEDLDAAAARELAEETGLPTGSVFLDQFRTFGAAGRDPRMRVLTVAYVALVRSDLAPFVKAGGDAADAGWHSVTELGRLQLAFDHREIVETALRHIRDRIEESNLAFELVPRTFTIPELRSVFEVVKGQPYDPGNFRRKFNRLMEDGVLEKAPGKRITGARPAQVFFFKRPAGQG